MTKRRAMGVSYPQEGTVTLFPHLSIKPTLAAYCIWHLRRCLGSDHGTWVLSDLFTARAPRGGASIASRNRGRADFHHVHVPVWSLEPPFCLEINVAVCLSIIRWHRLCTTMLPTEASTRDVRRCTESHDPSITLEWSEHFFVLHSLLSQKSSPWP
jgi:hypothetical protein